MMKILILGGSGLVGAALAKALRAQGQPLRLLSRNMINAAASGEIISADFAQLLSAEAWLPYLKDIDVVVNAVGIFSETAEHTFAGLHRDAPIALFQACEQAGVQRVVQLSALGSDEQACTAYWRSKAQADTALQASALDWTIIRPSLIYAPNGRSCRVFCAIASLPVLPVLQGSGAVQPVHLDDVIALLLRAITERAASRRIVNAVGPHAMSLTEWWQVLRQSMGFLAAPTQGI